MKSEKKLNDLIDEWHDSMSAISIHKQLGWTKAQYKRWVETGLQPGQKRLRK